MGMNAGSITGKGDAAMGDEAILERRDERGEAKDLLEPFFIMEGEAFMCQGIIGHGVRNPSMFIRKLFSFSGLFGRPFVPVHGKEFLPAGPLGRLRLCPEPVHEVKVGAKRGQGVRGTANEHGKEAVGAEFADPGGKAGKAEGHHKNKRAYDLSLVFGRASHGGIEPGKVFHGGIEVEQAEFFPDVREFKI